MGYELHITRRKQWFDEGDDISKEEFVAYVRSDPEFFYPTESGDDFAEWKSSSSNRVTWLQWFDGRILSKNPEPEFVDKMVVIAERLKATVQGDDGEIYRSSATVVPPDAPSGPTNIDPEKVATWAGRIFLVSIIALLGILYFQFR